MAAPLSPPRLILVLGATAAGKSKLAIELAQRFNGEVLSADSMQLYTGGLEIATNKVSSEEMLGVPHHMMSFLSPLTMGFTVFNFRNKAQKVVEEIHLRNRVPIIVGGTNYYIESLVWDLLIGDAGEIEAEKADEIASETLSLRNFSLDLPSELLEQSSAQLHAELARVDPEQAKQTHPNNRRKIIRSLQIFHRTGKPHSDLVRRQRQLDAETLSSIGGRMLYETIALWLQCEKEVLERRIDERCEEMVKRGLGRELCEFYERYFPEYQQALRDCGAMDSTKGLFQSIGVKEFLPFLALSPEERLAEKGERLFAQGVEALKTATKQYAKRQDRWVRNRLLRKPSRPLPPTFGFDASNPEEWNEKVLEKAERVVEQFLKGERPFAQEPLEVEEDEFEEERNRVFDCRRCEVVVAGRKQWEAHLRSKRHWREEGKARKELSEVLERRAKCLAQNDE